jgi:predicted TPR repeat methyltransferase
MPVSSSVQISDCLEHIIGLNPASVLDIGCGFGLWGFLCREYLDVWNLRVQPEEWAVRIEGVELWEPYLQPHQRYLYNKIHVGDVREVLPSLGEYELVIAGDVIEHLDKADAEHVVEQLYAKATRALMINIPLTGNWEHGICHGNPGELHRSQWVRDDFAPYPHVFKEYKLPCGEYGSFYCPKDCPPSIRATGLFHVAQKRDDRGDLSGAARALRQALAIAPTDEQGALALVDVLLRSNDPAGAVASLQQTLGAHPAFHYGRLTLARLLLAQGDRMGAAREAQALLAVELPNDLREQANALAAQVV